MPENNLPELRDIHLPDGVSAFPPAYGWWIMLLSILAVIAMAYLFMLVRRKSKKIYALHLLNNIYCNNSIPAVIEMSAILRRICVFKYKEATSLSGADWLSFLNSKAKKQLTGKPAELLISAPYIPHDSKGFSREDVVKIRQFCREWIGENR